MPDTVTVQIPTALRPQVDNQSTMNIEGATVGQVLGSIKSKYPDFGKRLYKSDDELNRFINVFVNDEDIRFLDNLNTPLKPGDEVAIVPAIAGG
ncbi:MAG: MoaD family protein [Phycisphaeraceae bacterium]|nr:MoaD family protein [Phycisphaeraceae bacterium]